MLIQDTESALNVALAPLLQAAFGQLVAWPGVYVDRQDGQPWVRVTHARAAPRRVTAGRNGLSEHPGLTQVDLWFPGGKGTAQMTAAAETLHAFFRPGVTLTRGAAQVQVYGRGLGTVDDRQQPWIWAPFTIRWSVFAPDDA